MKSGLEINLKCETFVKIKEERIDLYLTQIFTCIEKQDKRENDVGCESGSWMIKKESEYIFTVGIKVNGLNCN